MKKMMFKNDHGQLEPVLFMGIDFTLNSDKLWAVVMNSDQKYVGVPLDRLSLTTEDYNRVFAE